MSGWIVLGLVIAVLVFFGQYRKHVVEALKKVGGIFPRDGKWTDKFKKLAGWIAVAIAVGILSAGLLGEMDNPSVAAVAKWSQNHWLWVALLIGAVFLASHLLDKKYKPIGWAAVAVGGFLLFVGWTTERGDGLRSAWLPQNGITRIEVTEDGTRWINIPRGSILCLTPLPNDRYRAYINHDATREWKPEDATGVEILSAKFVASADPLVIDARIVPWSTKPAC